MANYVKFLKGTPGAYAALETKDANTLYFITVADQPEGKAVGKLYLGDILVAGSVTPDGTSIIDSLAELSDVNLKNNLASGKVLGYDGEKWVPMSLPEAVEVSDMTGATADKDGASGLVPMPKAGDHNKFLRGDGHWVEISTADVDLSEYAKDSEVKIISAKVAALEEIGAEKNIIQTVDIGTLNITEDRKLELKAVPQNLVTGLTKTSWKVQEVEDGDDIFIAQTTVATLEDILKPATFDPTTNTGTSGLMTAEQVQKLQALVITDEGIQVSGKVNADNVEGLSAWITTNRNTIEGLYPVEAKNLLDNLNSLVTDKTSGLNTKVNEHDSRIESLEEAMIWGSL